MKTNKKSSDSGDGNNSQLFVEQNQIWVDIIEENHYFEDFLRALNEEYETARNNLQSPGRNK